MFSVNATAIRNKIRVEADIRLGDTVDQLLELLRRRHTHESHIGACRCAYCSFIRTQYTDSKIAFHRANRDFNRCNDIFSVEMDDSIRLDELHRNLCRWQKNIHAMHQRKFDMLKDVL